MADYQQHFEKLSNHAFGLNGETLLNCFLFILALDIRRKLLIHKLFSIHQAIGLAKLVEAKIKDTKPKPSAKFLNPATPSATS